MSDTPRSDAVPKHGYRDAMYVDLVPRDFARQLEREIADAYGLIKGVEQQRDKAWSLIARISMGHLRSAQYIKECREFFQEHNAE